MMWIPDHYEMEAVPVRLRSERAQAVLGFLLRAELTAVNLLAARYTQIETGNPRMIAATALAGAASALSMVRAERRWAAVNAQIEANILNPAA